MKLNIQPKKAFHMPNPKMSIADKMRRKTYGPKMRLNKGLAPSLPRVKM